MNGLLAFASAHKVVTAVVVGAVVAGGGVLQAVTDSTTATVTKVVDGDTIDVSYGGETHRVRFLNVDAPESVDPDQPVECLGPEASEWLKQRLPVGTKVRLEHDQEVQDGYGRELAAVFAGEQFLSAEIARAGLGIAMSVGTNTKYLAPVQAAQAEAQAAQRGVYSTTRDCTIAAQAEKLDSAVSQVVSEAPASTSALEEFSSYAAELAGVAATANELLDVLGGRRDGWPLMAYTAGQVTSIQSHVKTLEGRLHTAAAQNTAAQTERRRQIDAEARRVAEEAARKAAEEAAREAAEEAARQAAAAADAQRQRSGSTSSGSSGSSSSSATPRTASPPPPASSGSSSGSSEYTGCRSYAPGGKTWTPIPC